MELLTFLSQESISDLHTVYCFVAPEYPALFLSLIKQHIRKKNTLTTLDTVEDSNALKASLGISFLGTKTFYWLCPQLFDAHHDLLAYITHYKGPNSIGFFNKKALPSSSKDLLLIDLPAEVTYFTFLEIFSFFYPQHAKKSNPFIKNAFTTYPTLSLDAAYLLMRYCMLIGSQPTPFLTAWLPTILNPNKSLFTLSSHFFAKKEQPFFELWNSLASDYSEPFWTTFWSEQLFKASAFISLNHAQNFTGAKRIGHRLPFSFMQKDWRSICIQELTKAHDHIYTIDWNIKNGLYSNFEHFYLNFFLNKFK